MSGHSGFPRENPSHWRLACSPPTVPAHPSWFHFSFIPTTVLLLTQPGEVPHGRGLRQAELRAWRFSQRLLRTSGSESRDLSLWGSKSSIPTITLPSPVPCPSPALYTPLPHSDSGLLSFGLVHCSCLCIDLLFHWASTIYLKCDYRPRT